MFMFKKGRRRAGGSRLTFISIVLIVIAVYVFRLVSPQDEVAYPDTIQYAGVRYIYTETVKGSPFMYTRKKPASDEGFIVLARRGVDISETIYIYAGDMRYRRYVVMEEYFPQ